MGHSITQLTPWQTDDLSGAENLAISEEPIVDAGLSTPKRLPPTASSHSVVVPAMASLSSLQLPPSRVCYPAFVMRHLDTSAQNWERENPCLSAALADRSTLHPRRASPLASLRPDRASSRTRSGHADLRESRSSRSSIVAISPAEYRHCISNRLLLQPVISYLRLPGFVPSPWHMVRLHLFLLSLQATSSPSPMLESLLTSLRS